MSAPAASPRFLHVRTIRLYGHAGADVPTTYLPREEVEAEEAHDPLLHSVRLLDQAGPDAPIRRWRSTRHQRPRGSRISSRSGQAPPPEDRREVMAA
jgi:2-oxoisovalerate dehydrogenase E1 component